MMAIEKDSGKKQNKNKDGSILQTVGKCFQMPESGIGPFCLSSTVRGLS